MLTQEQMDIIFKSHQAEVPQANWFVVEGDDGKYYLIPRKELEMGMTVLFATASRVSGLMWIATKEEIDEA